MRPIRSLRRSYFQIALSCGLAATGHATTYDCTTVSLPASLAASGFTGINNAGIAVGSNAIRDAARNLTAIVYPGAIVTQLIAINNNGLITGEYPSATGSYGFFTVDLYVRVYPFAAPKTRSSRLT
jgi:hypothetical protein